MKIETIEYKQFIFDIKSKIQTSQIKASIKVNVELLKLYWDIAEMIVEKQKASSWGDGFIGDISRDLKVEFPNMKGFSVRNIKYMRQWYQFFTKRQQVVARIFILKKIFKMLDQKQYYYCSRVLSAKDRRCYMSGII